MKLQTIIINVIGIILLFLLLTQIYPLFMQKVAIKDIVSMQDINLNSEIELSENKDRTDTSSFTPFYGQDLTNNHYISHSYGKIYEPLTVVSNAMDNLSIPTLDGLRTILESAYAVTLKDETKDASFNFCSKFGLLSSIIPALSNLGGIEVKGVDISDTPKKSREAMYELYSSQAIPTSPPMVPPPQPPPIPIITRNNDYIHLLTLSVRASFLNPFILQSLNINNKLDRKNGNIQAEDLGVVDCANQLYIPIRDSLNYFHNQYTNKNKTTPGDTVETASLSIQDSCAANAATYKIREFKQPGKYQETVPSWAKFIQVLIIGAGGGGGGGANGCDTGRRGHSSCGGGGGPSGNSGAILFTTEKIQLQPSSKYSVVVGAGGKAGDKGPSNTSQGGKGEDTIFTMNNIYMKVIGANGGPPGSPGYCNSNPADAQPSAILQQPTEVRGKFEYVAKKSIQGNIGKRGTPHWHRIWDTVGGQNGQAVYIDNLPELKLPNYSFFKIQKKYGYSGNGGDGLTTETTLEYHLLKLANPGGSGYVCVFFFAE